MVNTAAEELNQVFAEAAPIFEENLFGDSYQVLDVQTVRDTRGGSKEVEVITESGNCMLMGENTQGIEQGGIGGTPFVTAASYSALFPVNTTIEANDRVSINGREFEVTAVRRGGNWSVMTQVDLEERE